MKCDFCKRNDATIHLIRVQNDKIEKVNICEECARDFSFFSEKDFYRDLTSILFKIFSVEAREQGMNVSRKKVFKNLKFSSNSACPFCGVDLKNVKKMGMLGCPHCYQEFKEVLLPVIKKLHDRIEYRGKVPSTTSYRLKLEKSLRDLRSQLKKEIIVENFEKAAIIRDEIKQLEKNIYE
ncbi:MAG: UvrB/UvrC motif-containing protein [Actinobacteria bacterium]|nr:UvrB/UvrC motif-containing protein [Actinomycetota bacterium]